MLARKSVSHTSNPPSSSSSLLLPYQIPPSLGWTTSEGQPAPDTFSGQRKLINHGNENLQFEVELIRVRKKKASPGGGSSSSSSGGGD